MGVLFARIAGDLRGIEPASTELVIEEHASTGAALPVDVTQFGAGQVFDARYPCRVAAPDDQTLIAVHEPDHSDLGTVAEQPVDVGEGVLAGVGSSRCDPARWHSPSRNATRPPSEPTLDEASVISGSAERSAEAATSRTRSCGADGHDRAADLGEPAQQLDVHLLTGMVPFQPRRYDQQSVGADQ